MDTSETYIKMRIAAIPYLGMGTPCTKSPPCFITDTVWVDAVGNWYCIYHQGQEDAVVGCQLERQDQLQEMYLKSLPQDEQESENIEVVILNDFQDWVFNKRDGLDWSYKVKVSMEQLWLAFVMKEKYKKVWDSEDWKEV